MDQMKEDERKAATKLKMREEMMSNEEKEKKRY